PHPAGGAAGHRAALRAVLSAGPPGDFRRVRRGVVRGGGLHAVRPEISHSGGGYVMEWGRFFSYLAVMAGVTYLVRMLPLAVLRRKINSRFLLSFLYYAPYAVLGALTFPDILYATGTLPSALLGLAAALAAAWLGRPLLVVALAASAAAVLARLAGI